MIADKSRDYYIGASDTHFVMMSYDTKTFQRWWKVKTGEEENGVDTIYTRAGNLYEKEILDTLFIPYRNEQFIVGQLRVNLDGRTDEAVVEVKTTKNTYTEVKKEHLWQMQVEMFASGMTKARLIVYRLNEEDYEELNEIDLDRLWQADVPYNEAWILDDYLPRFNYLCWCFENEIAPNNSGLSEWLEMKGE